MEDTNVTLKYKDTMFRMIFREKENLLSLYNAVNGTGHADVDGLEIVTLENAIYMNYKNDVAFVFDFELMLYEHQSTANPNMPLRDLFYVAGELRGITRREDLYGPALVRIPQPRFAVFYNGTDGRPERETLRLSDAFEKKTGEPELELTVTAYNVNAGHNAGLLSACGVLGEYAQYVQRVRENAKRMPLKDAVERAVDSCIKEGILEDFLRKNRAEAIAVSIFEYNEEEHLKNVRETGYRSGREEGLKEGLEEGLKEGREKGLEEGEEKMLSLVEKLMNDGRFDDIPKIREDKARRRELFEEYGM